MFLRAGKQSGFSLVELVMVIVIMAIVSAVAMPKFFQKSSFSERAFFDDCLTALRYAQKLAVVTNCDVQVSFSANSYQLKRPVSIADCGVSTSSFSLAVPHPAEQGDYIGSEDGVATSDAVIVFYAKGNASNDATISVGSKNIKVVAKTGLVYAL